MSISEEKKAAILRYHHVEKWRVGTIARVLHVHHSTVKRVLSKTGVSKAALLPQKSMLDPYLDFIVETLDKYPSLTASRLYNMVCERGYPGGADHFRHLIALYRPKKAAEAYLRLRTLPGEQAQVDWGHFDYVVIGKAKRPVMAFVMVLSYSRKVFLRFYLNQRLSNFLDGHQGAFDAWEGVPKVLLYDNLKSAVLERQHDAIRFNPALLSFAAHYRFEPRPVAVARGNEKGRVERAIRYIRDNFFPAREWRDIDDLNEQAMIWCNGPASHRPCPEDKSHSVQAIFESEQSTLTDLPDNPYPVEETVEVKVGKTPYVRFDFNDYSVPHTHVRRILSVRATVDRVKIIDGMEVIAEHPRSYDKDKQIEEPSHLSDLVNQKKQARQHRGQDRLSQAIPCAADFLKKASKCGYSLRHIVSDLLVLLDSYGVTALEVAIKEALDKDAAHPNTVLNCLQKNRQAQDKLPPVRLDLPDDKRVRNQVIRPHKLDSYDDVQASSDKEDKEKTRENDHDDK